MNLFGNYNRNKKRSRFNGYIQGWNNLNRTLWYDQNMQKIEILENFKMARHREIWLFWGIKESIKMG